MTGYHLLDALVRRQHRKELWSVKKGVGSFITLDFGEKVVEQGMGGRSKAHGTVHIWVQYCAWVLRQHNVVQLTSNSPSEQYPAALKQLIGKTLVSISVGADDAGLDIKLSGGFELRIRPDLDEYDPGDDLLVVYEAGRAPLACSVEQGIYYE